MQAAIALACFDSPLPAAWQAAQIESMTASERARIARIYRPLRRDQFIIGHALLRRLLAVSGFGDAAIEVEDDGRVRVELSRVECHVSIAHSGGAVAATVASEPIGIDLEANRTLSDPRAAAAWLGLPDDPNVESEQVLTAWVAAEARFKAGPKARQQVWQTRWQHCLMAVAGVASAPQTLVFGMMAGTYNRTEQRWVVVASPAGKLG